MGSNYKVPYYKPIGEVMISGGDVRFMSRPMPLPRRTADLELYPGVVWRVRVRDVEKGVATARILSERKSKRVKERGTVRASELIEAGLAQIARENQR